MTRTNEIWIELENDKTLSRGLLLRRYSASALPDVYVALQQPESLRCIALRIQSKSNINLSRYIHLKDIRITIAPDDNDIQRNYLLIALLKSEHNEVFAILAEDLISQIIVNTHEEKLLKEVLNRFEKWKDLFDRAALEGLTPEEQRGLYGELYFLRKWINGSSNLQDCVQSWLGPEKELRDFQSRGWGIEVKTTSGNNHQKIHIASERQLDTSNLDKLFLYHLSIESQQQSGETLNHLVNSIIELLSPDISVLIPFKSKILQSGYFLHHVPRYESTGYHIRKESFYKVEGDFPRIEERDIRGGIGDVKYSIILSELSEYIVSESSLFEIIQ